MADSRTPCRLCQKETEFNVSLFGSFIRQRHANLLDKIFICLKLVVEEGDAAHMDTICFRCLIEVENYYNFQMFVGKMVTKRQEIITNERKIMLVKRIEEFEAKEKLKEQEKSRSSMFPNFRNWLIPRKRDDVNRRPKPSMIECKTVPRPASPDLFSSSEYEDLKPTLVLKELSSPKRPND